MSFGVEKSVEILGRTPAVLHAWLGGLSDFWARSNYGETTFSPFDVVGHLIEAEQTNWMTRLRVMIEHGDTKPFPPFDRYAMYEANVGRSMADLVESFASLRAKSLDELQAIDLTPVKLDLRGKHPDFGEVRVSQLIAAWVVHDLGHLHQVAKAMAFQYRDEVGPWREYLTILPK